METLYIGLVIKESLDDPSMLDDVTVLGNKVTDEQDPADRWHMYTIEVTRPFFEKIATHIKPLRWYAHFYNEEKMIVIFKDKIFEYAHGDTTSHDAVLQYGLALGIPHEQLDFKI